MKLPFLAPMRRITAVEISLSPHSAALHACYMVVLLLLPALYGKLLMAGETMITLSEAQYQNLGVVLGKPEPAQQIPLLNAPAKAVVPPAHEYIVSAAQAGLIEKLDVAAGDSVKQGQVLASINSHELVMLQQQYLQSASESRLAYAAYQRDKKLRDEGVIAERRWQETGTEYSTKASAENEAKQLLGIAGMSAAGIKRLAATRRLENRLLVRAPASGVVLERMAKVGERVAMQTPLYRIANLDELWLEIAVPQQRAASIKPGDRVIVENSTATARIALLGQSVDPQNQTVLARAVLDAKQTQIRAGQTVNAYIVQAAATPLFKVPNRAIAINEGQAYVFCRNDQGFTPKAVTLAGKQDDSAFIGGALQAGETIAVNGAVALKAKWLGLGEGEE